MSDPFLDGISKKSLPEFGKIASHITVTAAQNAILARVYNAQQTIMEVINLVGTIHTSETMIAAEHLHVAIENLESHIRKMTGRHSEDFKE